MIRDFANVVLAFSIGVLISKGGTYNGVLVPRNTWETIAVIFAVGSLIAIVVDLYRVYTTRELEKRIKYLEAQKEEKQRISNIPRKTVVV